MIQRIQSLYLLLITALMAAVLLCPLGVLTNNAGVFEFTAFSVKSGAVCVQPMFPLWILGALAALCTAIAFVTIFLYKHRGIQIRLCTVNGVLMVLFYVAYAMLFFSIYRDADVDYNPDFTIALPLIALILDILATKAISKDEALVQSLNRLR